MSQGKAYQVPFSQVQSDAPPPYPGSEGQGLSSSAVSQLGPTHSPYTAQQVQQMPMMPMGTSGIPTQMVPGQTPVDVWMAKPPPRAGCPPGLEVLDLVDSVQVERQFDVQAAFTNALTNVCMKVKSKTGHMVFFLLKEASSFDLYQNPTNYIVRAVDQNGMEVMRGVYSSDGCCGGCCSGSVCACTRPVEFSVHIPNGSVVADIEQRCSLCGIKYTVQNYDSPTQWTVQSGTCLWCYIRTAGTQFAMKEEGGRGALGTMTQTSFAAVGRALGTDSYLLQYESGLDAKTKAKMLMMSTYMSALYIEARGAQTLRRWMTTTNFLPPPPRPPKQPTVRGALLIPPIANPKGVKKLCELCKKPAFLACANCRVTYYCDFDHMAADKSSIHSVICRDLYNMRTPGEFLCCNDDRIQKFVFFTQYKERLMHKTRTYARLLLYDGECMKAIPPAQQSLKLATEIFGHGHVELAPSHLIMAEACIGNAELEIADIHIRHAEWLVLRAKDATATMKALLYSTQGLYYVAVGHTEEARRCFADAVYHASVPDGAHHIKTASGYFQLANAFVKLGNITIADSLYQKVATIWFTHLDKLIKIITAPPPKRRGVGPGVIVEQPETMDPLDEVQVAEAEFTLKILLEMRRTQKRRTVPEDVATIVCGLSMLYFTTRQKKLMREYGAKAMTACEECTDAKLIRMIYDYIKKIKIIK